MGSGLRRLCYIAWRGCEAGTSETEMSLKSLALEFAALPNWDSKAIVRPYWMMLPCNVPRIFPVHSLDRQPYLLLISPGTQR